MKFFKKYKNETAVVIMMIVAFSTVSFVKPKAKERERTVEVSSFDALEFGEAFNCMYGENGKGYIFEWRGNSYITLYKENR